MVVDSDGNELEPEHVAIVAVGQLALLVGFNLGASQPDSWTDVMKATVQPDGNLWPAVYESALHALSNKEDVKGLSGAIGRDLTAVVRTPERQKELLDSFFVRFPLPVEATAKKLITELICLTATRIGMDLGEAQSDWRPGAYVWVETYVTATKSIADDSRELDRDFSSRIISGEELRERIVEKAGYSVISSLHPSVTAAKALKSNNS